ncbi:unnamed protein product [Clonostachys rhizophaga]|uniref:Methyltransferase domain-containing protein n=1 Tax=Clonostachys rhizophaga TaxID=160324 RepID=A0A9N9VVC8_9HYPO|nr:unnamed protein product [Clonostachys rhizophaga]
MPPERPLPYTGSFESPDAYIKELLNFVTTSDIFRILCGGVHILDFFTIEPGTFYAALPEEWHAFLLSCDIMRFLDLLVREDLDTFVHEGEHQPPKSLIAYIRKVRELSLDRKFVPKEKQLPELPRIVAVGMKPKKIHEVCSFADYVTQLSSDIKGQLGGEITHFVDFGSGQNYLGRALASEPYNRHVVAVEGRDHNVSSAKELDMMSGVALKPQMQRNKKLWKQIKAIVGPDGLKDRALVDKAIEEVVGASDIEFRPMSQIEGKYEYQDGKGHVQYISGRLDSGDLTEVISEIDKNRVVEEEEKKRELKLMAVSIHSCGNLSHFGIRSLLMNPDIRAVAIVGCCYNLLTEKLGPPTYKQPYLRPTLQAVNGRVVRESAKFDPQGFPMSNRFSTHEGEGIRLNITARMMACQALENWTRSESEGFFTRHFYRAVLQKLFLDRGVVDKIRHRTPGPGEETDGAAESPFDVSTNPVIIGSVKKSAYNSFKSYVHCAVEKLSMNTDFKEYNDQLKNSMDALTDEEIERYEREFAPRKKELAIVWSLMAFSAIVVESLIVSDRWTFLQEHSDVVDQSWVETVFDFKQSPRNLVVVGIKK